jgi:cobalamin-dependent methionine synthase I
MAESNTNDSQRQALIAHVANLDELEVLTLIEEKFTRNETGTILLGTVKGDIHDIGKNNLSMLLTCYGFSAHDLGVDVPHSEFLLQAISLKPDIIGLSGLLTSSFEAMKETITMIQRSGDPAITSLPVVIGGNQLNEQVCE